MKVLVIGNGGREHALAWKLAQSPETERVFVAPGNGGTALDQALVNVPITDLVELVAWAHDQAIDLVVVGPEAPLAAGAVDLFRDAQIPVFGPTRAAAQLESSKAFSKAFMARHNIPTAAFESFTDVEAAHAYIDRIGAPIVVKADGLAAGKGVVVAMTTAEAHAAVDNMLLENRLGVTHNAAGARGECGRYDAAKHANPLCRKACALCAGNERRVVRQAWLWHWHKDRRSRALIADPGSAGHDKINRHKKSSPKAAF